MLAMLRLKLPFPESLGYICRFFCHQRSSYLWCLGVCVCVQKKRDDVKLEESKRQDVKKRSDSGKPEAASPAKQPDVHQAEWFSQWRGVRRKESAASCTPDRREKHTEAIRLLGNTHLQQARVACFSSHQCGFLGSRCRS